MDDLTECDLCHELYPPDQCATEDHPGDPEARAVCDDCRWAAYAARYPEED